MSAPDTPPFAVAIVLAYGRGERLKRGVPKAFVPLGDKPLVAWSLETLARTACVSSVVLVADPGLAAPVLAGLSVEARERVACVVEGGATRQQSAARGLAAVPETAEVVIVHDAARPFAGDDLFTVVAGAARAQGAALIGEPVSDTLKRSDGTTVIETIDRSRLWHAQTPQAARRELLVEAHARALAEGVEATDDMALVERLGTAVTIIPPGYHNPKITSGVDLRWAEAWIAALDERTRQWRESRGTRP